MIGKVIRIYRRRKGISINHLAEISGVSKSYLSKIERGVHVNPSVQFLKKISSTLEVELKELFDAETILHKKNTEDEEWRSELLSAVKSGMGKEELISFTNQLKNKPEKQIHTSARSLITSNLDEWRKLMIEAREIGLTVEEVRQFLKR
ncbi:MULTISPECIES: HTH-type transcriptional regulator SlrR [Bacillus]|uniref:Transcriptional regulator n=2 Tax=Bacillus TaxID=1386 RepID=A0A0M4FV43_9BACI|nr:MULTISPECIES: helix-turn-helix domain-containing protein [Bacillus]ALC82380.1 transcriptional regulator [Bacillus gobiensis]MBP1081255.1 HTH-type biofilm formation transcriptional regulator [Bacillus capparidis]MED1095933.1 helix-turn-helix domain-containing protein [Bacillus capparidis]